MKNCIAATSLFFLLLSCAGKDASLILVERGAAQYDKEWAIKQEGYGIDKRLKKIFLSGYITEGMNQTMVRLQWGPPDREFDEGKTWEFVSTEGNLISRVKFGKSEQLRLGRREMVVTQIEGDRYGGSLPPGSKPAQ